VAHGAIAKLSGVQTSPVADGLTFFLLAGSNTQTDTCGPITRNLTNLLVVFDSRIPAKRSWASRMGNGAEVPQKGGRSERYGHEETGQDLARSRVP